MSNRQARIARKRAQRAGHDAYVHLKPTAATPPEDRAIRVVVDERKPIRSLSKRHLRQLGLLTAETAEAAQ